MTKKKENIEKKNCPNCGSMNLIKKGKRQNKYKHVPIFRCKECSKKFSDSNFFYKTYSISQIVKALNFYNKGLTIKEASEKTNTPTSTIANWIAEYKQIFTMLEFATQIRKFKNNYKIIQTHKYEHGFIYLYQHHNFKLENIVKHKAKGLYEYLKNVSEGNIDKNIFNDTSNRASQVKLNIDDIKVNRTYSKNCDIAKMALEIARNNKTRHNAVEKTLLENDTETIAIEIPVYLNSSKTNMPFLKSFAKDNTYITGHIDILQIKNNYIYILDYKPKAAKEKPLGQLFVYACCLSRLTGLHFARIKLGWFDHKDYFETDTMNVYKNIMRFFTK